MDSVEENKEKLRNYILQPNISIHDPLPNIILRTVDINRVLHFPKCPATTKLVPRRDLISGNILDFIEVELNEIDANATNSSSMRRQPGLLKDQTQGSAMNYPFWPGGFDEPLNDLKKIDVDDFDFGSELLTTPPGFEEGYDFSKTEHKGANLNKEEVTTSIDLLQDLEKDLDVREWLQITKNKDDLCKINPNNELNSNISNDLDEHLLKTDFKPVLEISKTQPTEFRSEWAEMIDISQPINFETKIPHPAMKYPFELDTFQKQAILKLEERQYVFVAAHTSAGKTVVAEYAIAMSQRDYTRTIYTSPIKALSNQKYRDFKKAFKDVGLITGDMQIDPTATCLIMTTEILRSMLYCGSEITRDLEYVIFDEVHYINNPERGHVWEEVIILLPDHVQIIMLSATVPNPMELADWVGSTKKRKVYVVSTLKRPVPLMHYLYIPPSGKSKSNSTFVLVNAEGQFSLKNYNDAVEAKRDSISKNKHHVGPMVKQNLISKEEIRMWVRLIDYLKRNDMLPVVAFTLSRNRCDKNLQALSSTDLNTEKEKYLVLKFFQQYLQVLKPPDRKLPQVLTLKDSLERGIGVHHSGILPILKEIVEMLFQSGLVKLLFATETFAMGVNMPARTVVFDSHRKFDGQEVRNLKPGEYIQMAGRAGRRGHDVNGNVILLCKTDVPPSMDLKSMILGQPEKLQSQFILRYAVILTCLRIESIKVEDIMKYSFKEFEQKLAQPKQEKLLKIAEEKFSKLAPLGDHLKVYSRFYDLAIEYIIEKQRMMKFLLEQTKSLKELKIGRILIVTHGRHYNKLAILLSIKCVVGKDTTYRVLVLDHLFKKTDQLIHSEIFYKLVSLASQNKFFYPDGIGGHAVLEIKSADIIEVTRGMFRIDQEAILRNWEQRQIERFRDSPPSASVIKAVTELEQMNERYICNPSIVQILHLSKELNINDNDRIAELKYIQHLKNQINNILPQTNIPGFETDFTIVFERKTLERRIEELKFAKSIKNLSLYPDYCNKLDVLRALKYIDEYDEVTLKGKVACEMGQNELLITELILCNMFNDLEPAEIAALLSGLVFQSKLKENPTIPANLKKCADEFLKISEGILEKELRHQAIIETESRINFGLIEVVYQWAQNKPFAEIMKLTEIQEGIIVRCIQQLDEVLRDVKTAAIRIGNPALQMKMEAASTAIKRDIVFTASLYTSF